MRTLLRRCLQKDPKRRLQYVADARIEIEELLGGGAPSTELITATTPSRNRERIAWSIAALAVGLLALAVPAALYFRSQQNRTKFAFWFRQRRYFPHPKIVWLFRPMAVLLRSLQRRL
jgi:hypothetical protein